MQLILAQSTVLRMIAFALLYFAQGIPIGLFTIALPAWLAANGATAADVGTLVAVTGLPWAFKLVSGPFMDRFSFRPMGRRRPWVIASQLGLCLALAALVAVKDPVAELWAVIVIGTLVNGFAALQDVAVDGMAIDVLPVAERGRANALMAFGQVAGYSGFGALAGWLLVTFGLTVTAVVAALTVTAIVIFSTAVRERSGERLLPWSPGQAGQNRAARGAVTFRRIFRNLLRVLLLPMSLLLIGVELLSRVSSGISLGFMPVFAVQDLGYSAETFSSWMGLTGGAAALIGILVGPVIDRVGARRVLSLSLLGTAAMAILFGLTTSWWDSSMYVAASLMLAQLFNQGFFISMIALFMGICASQVAATQFAIYMSLANLSRSLGAGLYALSAGQFSSSTMLFAIAAFAVGGMLLLNRFDEEKHRAGLARLEEEVPRPAEEAL